MSDRTINLLRDLQLQVAQETLRRPKTENVLFEFGVAVGMFKAYELAIDKLLELNRVERLRDSND